MQFRFIAGMAVLASMTGFGQDHMRMRPGPPPGGPGDLAFVRPELGLMGKVVKSAPYSAQMVTQTNQTLSDGNHIQRTLTASVARDIEGRTRSEQTISAIGPLASGNNNKTVMIHDPVGGVSYMLNPANRTAHKMPAMRGGWGSDSSGNQTPHARGPRGGGDSSNSAARRAAENIKHEDL